MLQTTASTLKSNSLTNTKLRRQSSVSTLQNNKCICSLQSVDNQEFDFFPVSFLAYLVFVILLTSFICIIQILNYIEYKQNELKINELILFIFSIKSYSNHSLFEIHQFSMIHIFDYILVYGVMILSIWESLFSFYRFYTTYHVSITLKYVSTTQVFKKFMIYIIIYSISYILTIHLYYWAFPCMLCIYSVFNFYCNWKFAALLMAKYNIFTDMMKGMNRNSKNHEMLRNIYFMKRISFIGCTLQFIYLSAFIIVYSMTTIYTLPLIWALNGLLISVNFVRNRQAFRHIFICCNNTKHIKPKRSKSSTSPTDKSIAIKSSISPSSINPTTIEMPEMESYQINTVNKPDLKHLYIERKDTYHHEQKEISQPLNMVHLSIEEDLNTNTFIDPYVELSSHKKNVLCVPEIAINDNELLPLNQESKPNENSSRPSNLLNIRSSNKSKSHKPSKSTGNLRNNLSNPMLADGLNNPPISLPEPSQIKFTKHISAPTMHSVGIQNEENNIGDISIDIGMVMEMQTNYDNPSPTVNNDDIDQNEKQYERLRLQQQNDSIKEAILSLDVLSKYGFCSKSNLHSVNEINKLNKKRSRTVSGAHDILKRNNENIDSNIPEMNGLNYCSKSNQSY